MIQIKKTILTLVALLAVTAGAWAAQVELKLGAKIKNGDVLTFGDTRVHFTTPCSRPYAIYSAVNTSTTVTIGYDENGQLGYMLNDTYIAFTPLVDVSKGQDDCFSGEGESLGLYTGQTIPEYVMVTDGTGTYADPFILTSYATYNCGGSPVDGKAICDASDPSAIKVAWNKTAKTGTFTMPGGNVELEVEYYPGMLTLGNAIEGGKLEVVGMGLGTTSFTVPSEWNHNITSLTSGHFEGFKSVTEEEAKAWPGVPATGLVALFYNYDETEQKWDMIYFKDGAFYQIYKGYKQQLTSIYNLSKSNFSVFYTTGMQMPAGFEKDEEGNIYVEPGTKFQVKAVPDEGYHLVSLTDGTNDIEVDADGIATITMPDEYADLTLTATFSNEYDITFVEGTNPDPENPEWTATPNPAKTNQTVTVTYTGTKKVLGVKAEKKAAAPATVLGGALVDGATIKVNFKWRGFNEGDYVQGVYNAASGTFTVSKGGNYWGTDGRSVCKVEKSGDNIIIGAGFSDYNDEGMVWTFNTTNDTYTTTNGIIVNQDWDPGDFDLISVTLNGTDITSQLTAQCPPPRA